MKKNKLIRHVLIYFVSFAFVILSFLWIFEIFLFNKYYEYTKTKTISSSSEKIEKYLKEENYEENIDVLAYEEGICVDIDYHEKTIYTSESMERGCLFDRKKTSFKYKQEFQKSNLEDNTYIIINPVLNNKTLLYAKRIDEDKIMYINTSIEPVESSIKILKSVLIRITIVVFVIAIILSFYLSKMLTEPILKINRKAKEMARGNFYNQEKIDSNITEIQELNDTLDYAQTELLKIDETRRDLLANVSHDLKTPLTMIKAYAELNKDLSPLRKSKNEENMNIIIEESDRLNNLVNDILELSKLQNNLKELNKEEFDLTELIKSIINRFKIFDKEEYSFIFEYNSPVIINADKGKIEQVIYNLVINAMNYTGKDKKVIIGIEKKQKKYRVSIKDSGKGIESDEINLIWDKYYKNERHHKRNKVGTGLGLSIVKEIFLLHNYNYGVYSKKGKGTTFYFDIDV